MACLRDKARGHWKGSSILFLDGQSLHKRLDCPVGGSNGRRLAMAYANASAALMQHPVPVVEADSYTLFLSVRETGENLHAAADRRSTSVATTAARAFEGG